MQDRQKEQFQHLCLIFPGDGNPENRSLNLWVTTISNHITFISRKIEHLKLMPQIHLNFRTKLEFQDPSNNLF